MFHIYRSLTLVIQSCPAMWACTTSATQVFFFHFPPFLFLLFSWMHYMRSAIFVLLKQEDATARLLLSHHLSAISVICATSRTAKQLLILLMFRLVFLPFTAWNRDLTQQSEATNWHNKGREMSAMTKKVCTTFWTFYSVLSFWWKCVYLLSSCQPHHRFCILTLIAVMF